MWCRNCQKKKANRPRQLCWTCYYNPKVREHFPSTSKYARRGVGHGRGEAPLPEMPTSALPGTEEKIRVLAERAARNEELFHPDDAKGSAGSRRLGFQLGAGVSGFVLIAG